VSMYVYRYEANTVSPMTMYTARPVQWRIAKTNTANDEEV